MLMKILSWNCWGLGNFIIVNVFWFKCWRESFSIIFMMEIMIFVDDLFKVYKKCGFWEGIGLSIVGFLGRLGFWWCDFIV